MSESVQRDRGRLRWLGGLAAGLVAGGALVSAVRLTAEQAKAPPAKPAAKAEEKKEKAPAAPAKAAPVQLEDVQKQGMEDAFALMHNMMQVLEDVHAKGAATPADLNRLMGGVMQAQKRQLDLMQRLPPLQPPAGFGPRNFGPRNFGPRGIGPRMGGLPAAQGNFHASAQDGAVSIDVSGTVQNGKVVVDRIDVQDGGRALQFNSVEQVPAAYQERVRGLIERFSKARGRAGARPLAVPR